MIAETIIGDLPMTEMRESVHPACTGDNKEFGACPRGEFGSLSTAEFRSLRTPLGV